MTVILLVVVAIVFWSSLGKINGRITSLEKEVQKLRGVVPTEAVQPREGSIVAQESAGNLTGVPQPYSGEQKFTPQASSPTPPKENLGGTFFDWLQKDLLMKIGALLLLMGFGWFVSYAFIHEWIGPIGRITLGLVSGALVLILGIWRIKTNEHQGAIFTVLGSTIVLLTVYAGRSLYDFFTPHSALGLMFLSVLFVTFVSLKYRRNSLALAGLILAAIAPYLTASPRQDLTEHFFYLLVIILGTLWVVYITGWRNLTFTALVITCLTTAPFGVVQSEKTLALLWVFIFVAIFFIANIVSIIRQKGVRISQVHLFTALGTALFLVAWIFGVAPEESRSLLLVFWMLVFSVGAFLVYRTTEVRSPFYVYGATSIGLLAAATTAELDGAVLTIALTFEVAVLVFLATLLRLENSVVNTLSMLFIGPIMLSFESMGSRAWNTGVIHADFFNLLVLTLVLLIVGLFINERNKILGTLSIKAGEVLTTLGATYALLLLWLVMHGLVRDDDTATMITLIMYTVIGLVAYYSGKVHGNNALRIGGGAILGFVVCRLLVIDVWKMELAGRIITFFVVGILLISTAFMGRKHTQE